MQFNGVKIFSATMLRDRADLGDRATNWLEANRRLEVVDIVVTQSSDDSFHMTAISIFYLDRAALLGRSAEPVTRRLKFAGR